MTTRHTPQDDRQQQGAAAGTPPVLAMNPNQNQQVVMSPDQLQRLIDGCNRSEAADADFPGVNSVAVKLPTF